MAAGVVIAYIIGEGLADAGNTGILEEVPYDIIEDNLREEEQ